MLGSLDMQLFEMGYPKEKNLLLEEQILKSLLVKEEIAPRDPN